MASGHLSAAGAARLETAGADRSQAAAVALAVSAAGLVTSILLIGGLAGAIGVVLGLRAHRQARVVGGDSRLASWAVWVGAAAVLVAVVVLLLIYALILSLKTGEVCCETG
jgi:uncharacterized membrane protein YidH (DUF202 family)